MTPAVTDSRLVRGRQRRPSGEPPPLPHEINSVAVGWLIAFVFWAILWMWVFVSDDPARWITELDLELMAPIVEHRAGWLTPVMRWADEIGTSWLTPLVGWVTIVAGLLAHRVRHVLLVVASLTIVGGINTVIALMILRPRPLGVEQLGDWSGPAQPSRPVALLTTVLVGAGLSLVPSGRARRAWIAVMIAIVGLVGFARVYLGVDHPSDVLPAATLGVAVTLVLFRVAAPEAAFPIVYHRRKAAHLDVGGARGAAIRSALRRQLGIDVTTVEWTGLAGSGGSTPLRIGRRDGADLFGKLYARSHLRADRSYKLGRALLYGRLEDEHHFNSVRRLVQHEDYMLHVVQQAGIDTMRPMGIVEITPDREYLLVTEFLDGALELDEVEMTTELIDEGLRTVSRLWDAGLAHRDIKPANIMVQDGELRLVDLSFAEIRPSPWRQAVDLANMMLVLALGSSPELVYDRAVRSFSEQDIAEAFAAARGLTLPSGLRAAMKADGRDLLGRFRALAPAREPVAIQRWSLRRIGLMVWVVAVTAALVAIFVGSLEQIGLR